MKYWYIAKSALYLKKQLRDGKVRWGVLTACIPFAFFPWTIFTYLMSHIICLDLWQSGKRFRGNPKEDDYVKNGVVDFPLWCIIPGYHLIHVWVDCVKKVPLLKEGLELEVQLLQSRDGHHYFTDSDNEKVKQLREVQISIQKINQRTVTHKMIELFFESFLGAFLQSHITLMQAGSLKDMFSYLVDDYNDNGIFGSIASSLLSSYLSILISA